MDKKTIATGLIASTITFGATTLVKDTSSFDTKGQDVKIQVIVKEKDYQDAVYYTPEEWNAKTQNEIDSEKQKRFNDWKNLVEQESKKVTEEIIDEINI